MGLPFYRFHDRTAPQPRRAFCRQAPFRRPLESTRNWRRSVLQTSPAATPQAILTTPHSCSAQVGGAGWSLYLWSRQQLGAGRSARSPPLRCGSQELRAPRAQWSELPLTPPPPRRTSATLPARQHDAASLGTTLGTGPLPAAPRDTGPRRQQQQRACKRRRCRQRSCRRSKRRATSSRMGQRFPGGPPLWAAAQQGLRDRWVLRACLACELLGSAAARWCACGKPCPATVAAAAARSLAAPLFTCCCHVHSPELACTAMPLLLRAVAAVGGSVMLAVLGAALYQWRRRVVRAREVEVQRQRQAEEQAALGAWGSWAGLWWLWLGGRVAPSVASRTSAAAPAPRGHLLWTPCMHAAAGTAWRGAWVRAYLLVTSILSSPTRSLLPLQRRPATCCTPCSSLPSSKTPTAPSTWGPSPALSRRRTRPAATTAPAATAATAATAPAPLASPRGVGGLHRARPWARCSAVSLPPGLAGGCGVVPADGGCWVNDSPVCRTAWFTTHACRLRRVLHIRRHADLPARPCPPQGSAAPAQTAAPPAAAGTAT